MNKFILVTGGLGFIGSHVVVQLLNLGNDVLVLDNLSNSKEDTLDNIKKLKDTNNKLEFIKGDIRNKMLLNDIFNEYDIELVMHFAALKSVNESQKYPELYYDVNVDGSIILLNEMKKNNITKFIYSSSATVYGDEKSPVNEKTNIGNNLACNYAKNKYTVEKYIQENKEKLLEDFDIVILRYFNPVGAHESGLIGDDPNGLPNNIFPYLLRVAKYTNDNNEIDNNNPYSKLTIFGKDYNTRDGTCIRDYIHVQDLSRAHIEIIPFMKNKKVKVYNVGTGKNVSVLEFVNALNKSLLDKNKKPINYVFGEKRDGDLDISYADVKLIKKDIGFECKYDIYDMCNHGLSFIGI